MSLAGRRASAGERPGFSQAGGAWGRAAPRWTACDTTDAVPVRRRVPGGRARQPTGDLTINRRPFLRSPGQVQRTRVNHMIRMSPIRLIDQNNQQVGVIDTGEALRMAQEAGLDLVEIQPDSRPPICKIMDYGKHRYELSKQSKDRKNSGPDLKEIRLGRSIKIDPHDVKIRVDQARRFLMAGHKVQFTQRFRGREMMYKDQGLRRLRDICDQLGEIAKVEVPPRWLGKQTSIVLAPMKDKIDAIKRKMTEEERKREAAELEAAEKARLAELAADDAEGDDDDEGDAGGKGGKKGKGPADDRARNPVDDEIAELLGE